MHGVKMMCTRSTCLGKLLQLGTKERLLCLTAFLLSYRYGHKPDDIIDGLRGDFQH